MFHRSEACTLGNSLSIKNINKITANIMLMGLLSILHFCYNLLFNNFINNGLIYYFHRHQVLWRIPQQGRSCRQVFFTSMEVWHIMVPYECKPGVHQRSRCIISGCLNVKVHKPLVNKSELNIHVIILPHTTAYSFHRILLINKGYIELMHLYKVFCFKLCGLMAVYCLPPIRLK